METVKRHITMVVVLVLQVFIFNHIHILGFATPMICIYPLLTVSLKTPRWQLLIESFILGSLQDIFSNTAGMNAASLTLIAMMLHPLQTLFHQRDTIDESSLQPFTTAKRGWKPFITYATIAIIIQQTIFYVLEIFSFFNLKMLGINIITGSIISLFILLCIESVRKAFGKN